MAPASLALMTMFIGTGLPLLTGLVSKASWHSGVKAVILLALSAITGLGTEALNASQSGGGYDLTLGAVMAFGAFLTGVGVHFGLLTPTGAAHFVAHKGIKD